MHSKEWIKQWRYFKLSVIISIQSACHKPTGTISQFVRFSIVQMHFTMLHWPRFTEYSYSRYSSLFSRSVRLFEFSARDTLVTTAFGWRWRNSSATHYRAWWDIQRWSDPMPKPKAQVQWTRGEFRWSSNTVHPGELRFRLRIFLLLKYFSFKRI